MRLKESVREPEAHPYIQKLLDWSDGQGKAHHSSDLFSAERLMHGNLVTLLYGKPLLGLAISGEYVAIAPLHRASQAR